MSENNLAPFVPFADVEWRVDGQPVQNQGQPARARFVPYVNASTVAKLLDEWVGPGNWSDAYFPADVAGKPALWCELSVRINDDWVTKRDVGVSTQFEAQKGMVSDAFKRVACIKWGVARNVYSLPSLWAPCRVTEKNGKLQAWATAATLPAIHKQLQEMGYEPSGRLATEEQEVSQGSPDGAAEKATSPSQRDDAAPADSSVTGPDPVPTDSSSSARGSEPQAGTREAASPSPASAPEAAEPSAPQPSPDDALEYLTSLPWKEVAHQARLVVIERAKGDRVPTKVEHLADLPPDCLAAIADKMRQGALV